MCQMLSQNPHRSRGLLIFGLVALICILIYYVRAPRREESVPGGSHVHQHDNHNPYSQLEFEDYYYNSDDKGMIVK